jgi:hypothetical protein
MTIDQIDTQAIEYDYALRAISDPDRRQAIIDATSKAVEAANAREVDVVLLAARRMTCIYALLRQSGMPAPTHGSVVSDRFIELTSPDGWVGKRVLLMDDTTVTGETLDQRAEVAQRLVGRHGQVDRRPVIDLTAASDDEGFALHRQFAMAFGQGLVPFFTDFPISHEQTVSAQQFDDLLSCTRWRTVDVTNAVTAGTGARSFSLFPSAAMLTSFVESLGKTSEILQVVKFRVFAFDDDEGVRVRLVPIVLLAPLAEASLQEWVRSVGIEPTKTAGQSAQAAGLASFLLARELFAVLAREVQEHAGIAIAEDIAFANLNLGSELNAIATSHHLESLAVLTPVTADRMALGDPTFDWPEVAENGSHFSMVGDDVVLPGFTSLREADERRDKSKRDDWAKNATTLTRIAAVSTSNVLTATLAVDVLNDLGLAVPAPLVLDGEVFRGYRAGEAGLRDAEDFAISATGGRFAAFEHTIQIPDEQYFSASLQAPRA